MDALTGRLGVDCTYCHVAREWDKEDKPQKQTARSPERFQSLAGIPAKELPGIMVHFSQALGVECAHCHVTGHWDQDTPAKQTARKCW